MLEDNPLVTILIPCWRCRQYIGKAIQSAIDQDYRQIEIIVVEDSGDDGTYEEAIKFKDPRLRVFKNQTNLGQYGNKNKALTYAQGKFLKYLDGDDVLENHCVSTLIRAWKQNNYWKPGIVFAQYKGIDQVGRLKVIPRRWGFSGLADGKKVLDVITKKRQPASRFGNVSPHLFYRPSLEAVGGFANGNSGFGDNEFYLKSLALHSVYFLDTSVAYYRKHQNNIGSKLFGIEMCYDNIRMVENLTVFFRTIQNIPNHLIDQKFIRDWLIWGCGHNILSSFQHKIRGKQNQFDVIKKVYYEKGLKNEFNQYILKKIIPYLIRTLITKIRKKLNLPQQKPLFTKSEINYISIKTNNSR
jgi:glycosyltransferase involved in cell wall biosynthesis